MATTLTPARRRHASQVPAEHESRPHSLESAPLDRQDYTSAFDEATFTQVFRRGDQWPCHPQALELTDAQMKLPLSLTEFPEFDQGLHERPRNRYSDVLQTSSPHVLYVLQPLRPAISHNQAARILSTPQSRLSRLLTCPWRSQLPQCSPLVILRRVSRAALGSTFSGCLLFHSLTCRHPSCFKRVLAHPCQRSHLGAHRPWHLVAKSSPRCRWRSRLHQQV